MENLTPEQRVELGAQFLDERTPGWFLDPDADPERVDMWNLKTKEGLGRILSMRKRPLSVQKQIEEIRAERSEAKRQKIPPKFVNKLSPRKRTEQEKGRKLGLTDKKAAQLGFTVPYFDAESHEELEQKRRDCASKLSEAWQQAIQKRRMASCPDLKATVSSSGISDNSLRGGK